MKHLTKYFFIFVILFTLVSCNDDNTTQSVVKATINYTSLPSSFTYDLDTTQNGTNEYAWEISFDINNDSIINEGDLYFGINLIAFDATPQQTINRSDMQAYIWLYGDRNPAIAHQGPEIILTSTDTSFTFTANVGLHRSLERISTGTQVFVKTLYKDKTSGTYYYDYYPSNETYTVGLDTGFLEDTKLDFETNVGPVTGVDYPFIDIENISIAIE